MRAMETPPTDATMTPEAFSGAASRLYLDHLALTLTEALRALGIRAVLLKGASLRYLLYDDDEVRRYTDVDLLVAPQNVARAAEFLEGEGFRDRFKGAGAGETVSYAREFRSDRAYVDLHWSLPGVTVADTVAWGVLTDQTDELDLRDGRVEVLTVPGRALHVALHWAHNGFRQTSRLDDLDRAARRLPLDVWSEAAGMADALGALAPFVAGLNLHESGREVVSRLGLDAHIPTGVALRAGSAPPLAVGFDRLFTTPGIRAKIACLAREVVPTPAGMRYWSPLARRGPAGLVSAYLWRPLYLFLHAPRAMIAWRRVRAEGNRIRSPSRRKP